MSKPTVIFGSDHAGYPLKEYLKEYLSAKGYHVEDEGPDSEASCDYPIFAQKVCQRVLDEKVLGVLICGTGIGMSMSANKIKGIRAALCTNEYLARLTRQHNNANVLCLGQRVTGIGLAASIADAFLEAEFEGGRHQRRLDLMENE